MFAYAGQISLQTLLETTPLAVASLLALFAGFRLQKRIAVDTYRKILRYLLALLAVILIVQFSIEI